MSDVKPIFLDLDGVLADFNSAAAMVCNIDVDKVDMSRWDWFESAGITYQQFWESIEEYELFWVDIILPYHWAQTLVDLCRRFAPVIFCTQPGRCSSGASQKIDWLRNHEFMDDEKNDYIVCGDFKHMLAGSGGTLIDDRQKNIDCWRAAGGTAITFPQPWNQRSKIAIDAYSRLSHVHENLVAIYGPEEVAV